MDEIDKIVKSFKEKGIDVCDSIIENLVEFCNRKMELCRTQDKETYLPLLFEDELKNMYIRGYVNNANTLKSKLRGESNV